MIKYNKLEALRMANICAEFYYPTNYYRKDGLCEWGYNEAHNTIVWRGTDSRLDWYFNFDTKPVYWIDTRYKVHRGFRDFFDAAEIELNKLLRSLNPNRLRFMCITGHSLGAAIGTLCAIYVKKIYNLNAKLYTFGSPMVVSAKSPVEIGLDHFRFVNGNDIITRVPIGYGYFHISNPIILNGSIIPLWLLPTTNQLSLIGDHFINKYINALERTK